MKELKTCYSIGYYVNLKHGKSHVIVGHLDCFKEFALSQLARYQAKYPDQVLEIIPVGSSR